jgi:SAM-dependent methyltransferase
MASHGRYVELTESWHMPMPAVQQDMIFRRYSFFRSLSTGPLLEVGCGQSLGNEVLLQADGLVVSCDLEMENVSKAKANTAGEFAVSDATYLPFAPRCFDGVAACEMIYYVADQPAMVREMVRVLRPGGAVFIACANPERPSFHESPYSTHYPSARGLTKLLGDAGLEPTVYGVFPLDTSMRGRTLRLVAGVATKLHLVPKTLAGRGTLKRIFFGELTPYEGTKAAAQRDAEIPQPVRIPGDRRCDDFRVLYAVGRLAG